MSQTVWVTIVVEIEDGADVYDTINEMDYMLKHKDIIDTLGRIEIAYFDDNAYSTTSCPKGTFSPSPKCRRQALVREIDKQEVDEFFNW